MKPGNLSLLSGNYFPGEAPANSPLKESDNSAHTVLYYVGQVILFPLRLMGMLLLVVLVGNVINMWKLPTLASQNNLDLTLLTLSATNQSKSVRPFYSPLGYRETVKQGMLDIEPESIILDEFLIVLTGNYYCPKAISTISKPTPEGYEHVVSYNYFSPQTFQSTSPHLTVPKEELIKANHLILRLFPKYSERSVILDWGQSLLWSSWFSRNNLNQVPIECSPKPSEGTELEHTWLVWQILSGNQPHAETELFQLNQLFLATFPNQAEQTQALEWAVTLYDRYEEKWKTYQEYLQMKIKEPTFSTSGTWDSFNMQKKKYAELKSVLPPKTQWTYLWLLYRYVGLSEASRQAAKDHWRSCFPTNAHGPVEELGKKIAAERRSANEPLPPVEEIVPWICVVERLTGSDRLGQRSSDLLKQTFGLNQSEKLHLSLISFYPNDELYYLMVAEDELRIHPIETGESVGLQTRLIRVLGSALIPLVSILGLMALLNWILAPRLLPTSSKELWYRYNRGRGHVPIWLWTLAILFFSLIAALAAPYTLSEYVAVQITSFDQLYLGALAATIVGGMLIVACCKIMAFFLVLIGIDLQATWFDEVLGVIIGGFILFHFDNSILQIAIFAASQLTPMVIWHYWTRGRRPVKSTSSEPKSKLEQQLEGLLIR